MFSAIAAMAENRVIGCHGQIPWYLPVDLKNFRSLTLGKTVIMGRKTFESIGQPLRDRQNIIVSSQGYSVGQVLRECPPGSFVIGGEQIYRVLLPHVSTIHLTLVAGNPDGDAFFPSFEHDFVLTSRYPLPECEFRIYRRVHHAAILG